MTTEERKVLAPRSQETNSSEELKIQASRYNNLKTLLSKSSRYADLMLMKVNKEEDKKQRYGSRKRKNTSDDHPPGSIEAQGMSKEQLQAISDGTMTIPEENENLNEFDTPSTFKGELRDYQKKGMNWLLKLFVNAINGILADEMGLGKTIQVIAHFCNLLINNVKGPFLIIAPLSTLNNWVVEFGKFAPHIPTVLYHGSAAFRSSLRTSAMQRDDFPYTAVVTNYETAMTDRTYLAAFEWQYIVVDEGHRLKNINCRLLRDLRSYRSNNRLLLTGTPLQNNLSELWALLHFLMPEIFADLESFYSWLEYNKILKKNTEESAAVEITKQENFVLETMHQILSPFLLRRIKSEVSLELPAKKEVVVFCRMSDVQRQYYKLISERTIEALINKKGVNMDRIDYDDMWENYGRNKNREVTRYKQKEKKKLDQSEEEYQLGLTFDNLKLTNYMVLLRRAVNHPYLIKNPHDTAYKPYKWHEDYVTTSGKMVVLEKMLSQLYSSGHKVLLFSQWTMILDMIEDCLGNKPFKTCRIDGSTSLPDRQAQIDEFNQPGSDLFLFMLTTRAGGLGINLTSADTVIIFDSDWNPQMDLQAQDRCHRIGQTKPVIVYRLVTANSVDSAIVSRARSKRKLEQMVLQKGRFDASRRALTGKVLDVDDLKAILAKQDEAKFECSDISDQQIQHLLDRDRIFQTACFDAETREDQQLFEVVSQDVDVEI